jgi:hypothetical protein
MKESKLDPAESLNLIDSMLRQAKAAEKDNGVGWIMWGWLLFIASISDFIAIKVQWPYRNYIWAFFGIIAIALIIYSVFVKYILNNKKRVTTYTGQLVGKLMLAFLFSMLVVSYGNYKTGANFSGLNFAYLMILYAFWMFIFAAAFKFNLFYWGAAFNWLGALIIFYYIDALGPAVLLVHAACVAVGYLIPGHMAYKNFKEK